MWLRLSNAVRLELVKSLASYIIELLLSRSLLVIHHALTVEAATPLLSFHSGTFLLLGKQLLSSLIGIDFICNLPLRSSSLSSEFGIVKFGLRM